MISINDLVQMSVVLDDEFLLFSKNRPDSFVFLLTEVSERNYVIASRAQKEIIKSEPDVSALFYLIYKRRNLLDTDGLRLRQWSPLDIIFKTRYLFVNYVLNFCSRYAQIDNLYFFVCLSS